MRHSLRTYLVAAALAPSAAIAQSSADLILRNGRIYTVDENKPLATAIVVSATELYSSAPTAKRTRTAVRTQRP